MRISDHALLRYLERVENVDIEDLRDQMMSVCAPGIRKGAINIQHQGVVYCVEGEVVRTVFVAIDNDTQPNGLRWQLPAEMELKFRIEEQQ